MAVTEAEFRAAILPFTLGQEGGLSQDRSDPGNWSGGKIGVGTFAGTKYGIAAASHPTLDIRALTLAQACSIYWLEYCLAPGFAWLNLPLLQVVFDAAVNCGPSRARAWLALAATAHGDEAQIRAFSAANLAYHRRLATWPRYGKVWGARIAACERRALMLAEAAPVAVPARVAPPRVDTSRPAPRAAQQLPAGLLARLVRAAAGTFLAHTRSIGA